MNKTLLFTRRNYITLKNITEEATNAFAKKHGIDETYTSLYEDLMSDGEVSKIHIIGVIEDTPIYLFEYKEKLYRHSWLSFSLTDDIELAAKHLFEDILTEWKC